KLTMNVRGRVASAVTSRRLTDYVAAAIAIALPWSTSITAILMTIWVLAYLPSFDLGEIRREACTWAGGLPLVLLAWAAAGLFWSEASWADSLAGLRQFHKLLFIPVLLAYFRRSDFGIPVMSCLIASCIALLVVALTVEIWPWLQWWPSRNIGVPVKTYISQSAEFTVAAFCLIYLAAEALKARRVGFAAAAALIALAFLADIFFIVTSRTELVAIAGLIVLFGARFYKWKGFAGGLVVLACTMALVWSTSDYVQERISDTAKEIEAY